MQSDGLEILYQDEFYTAINKPSGLLVHPTIIDRHEKRTAMGVLRKQLGKRVYIIHRLDKATSGVLLFAMSSEAAKKCAEQFMRNEVYKTYLAVVRGYTEERGLIDSPLDEIPDKLFDKRNRSSNEPKAALTEYFQLGTAELPVLVSRYPQSRYSLIEVRPKTGRMHQIRRHLQRIHHPVIGDTKHGDHKHNRYFKENWNAPRMLLAATELTFIHPYSQVKMTVVASLDDVFNSVIRGFEWQDRVPESWMGVTSL